MSEEAETFRFDGWAIIEFMGHRRRAGKVRTAEIGGTAVFVVETPDTEQEAGVVTEIYAASALYCLTPCTEEVARIMADSIQVAPVSRYDLPLPMRKALADAEEAHRAQFFAIGESDEHDEQEIPFG